MSLDHPSDAPSPNPEPAGEAVGMAALLRSRGEPLVEALDAHRPGAHEHAEGTASYAFATAVELGFERAQCEVAREVAKLHEVGQIYVPAAVLAKSVTDRDADQQRAFESHYESGYRLARGAGIPEHACGWLLRARENYDGSGPERVSGDAIPIEARLIRAACTCQTVLAEPAPPDDAAPAHGRAVASLGALAGAELDPRVAGALVAVIERAGAFGA
jgi:HD-GYP domain-containing protein (c-di-GMP phosphodiesterase class II)